MNIDWSTTGHGLPVQALRNSEDLKIPHRVKAREARIAWEKMLKDLEAEA
jgi:hypothetical protein